MANIYDELKGLISHDVIGKLAGSMGGNTAHAENAAHQIMPALLAKFMTKSDSPAVHGLLQDAGKLHLPGVDHLLDAGTTKKPSLGEKFVSAIMGSQEGTLHSFISKEGLSPTHAKGLTAGVGAVLAGFLGKRMLQHGGAEHVMKELSDQKNSILASVPSELKEKLHLSSDSMHCAAPHHKAAATHKSAAKSAVTSSATRHDAPKKKGGLAWLWWLLLAILACLLLFWLLGKGCTGCRRTKVVETTLTEVVAVPAAVATTAAQTAEQTLGLALPDGKTLSYHKGGMIDKLVEFLKSDTYKNADEAYLQSHWFEFENIDFEYNSSTKFVENAEENVHNIASVLKAFPDAKIRIGGKGDMKGSKGVNFEISKARALTIKNEMVQEGVAAARISTEGFGKELAVIPATATDAERAPDRDFAMRFMK